VWSLRVIPAAQQTKRRGDTGRGMDMANARQQRSSQLEAMSGLDIITANAHACSPAKIGPDLVICLNAFCRQSGAWNAVFSSWPTRPQRRAGLTGAGVAGVSR
jgi:hypothetical protein